jgi:chromate transporter
MERVPPSPLKEIASLFLRLGATAFGGPAAHIAMMQDEVVRRRQWVTDEEFLDLLGATNLIPGPNSTELAIHLGHKRGGWPGLVLAGACFILPAFLIVGALGWLYVSYGSLPEVEGLLYGVKPVLIAIVLQALYALGKKAFRSAGLTILGVGCLAAVMAGMHELAVLFGAGALWMVLARAKGGRAMVLEPVGFPALLLQAVPAGVAKSFGLGPLFLFFLKVGSVLFGSGYVLLAFLRADLVERWGWLTEAQLLDAIAIGQVTPGPVFTTATFIGYVLGGFPGAVVATVGIFLPAFVFVALSGPLVPRLRSSRTASAFLDGVNVASLALMALVTWQLGRSAIGDLLTLSLAVISAVVLWKGRVNSVWLILVGGATGLIARALGGF